MSAGDRSRDAHLGTIRRKLFKIGALFTISVSSIKFAMDF